MYVDDIESDDEDQDLDTLDSVCRGHGISIFTDPCNIRFQIFSTRIDEQSKRVVSILCLHFDGLASQSLLVALYWGPCDRLASHPGGVVILPVASCWVSCDRLATHPGGVVILLVASCWVPCEGLTSHPGGVVILLVSSCWVSCDRLASHPGEVVILPVASCWVSYDGQATHPGEVVIGNLRSTTTS